MAEKNIQNMVFNFGPQHPASHGVLRLVMEMDGENIVKIDPIIGQLHRGTEKLMEHKTYLQATPYMDRLDYVAPLAYEQAWSLAVEKMLGVDIPKRAKYIRVLVAELTRIRKHLFCLGATVMDLGAMTPMIWGLELQERIMEFFVKLTGARFHCNYIRPGGVFKDIQPELLKEISDSIPYIEKITKDIGELVWDNRIFKQRMVDIAIVNQEKAVKWGFTGVNLRASGLAYDIRKAEPYDNYQDFDFDVVIGKKGDNYDRLLVRYFEIFQSIRIIKQVIEKIPAGEVNLVSEKISPPKKEDIKHSMEALIHHFKYFSEGFNVPAGELYQAIEAPMGEFGIYLISDGSNKPYRVRMRSPGFAHLQMYPKMCHNHFLADAVGVLGSIDVVFGEIDR